MVRGRNFRRNTGLMTQDLGFLSLAILSAPCSHCERRRATKRPRDSGQHTTEALNPAAPLHSTELSATTTGAQLEDRRIAPPSGRNRRHIQPSRLIISSSAYHAPSLPPLSLSRSPPRHLLRSPRILPVGNESSIQYPSWTYIEGTHTLAVQPMESIKTAWNRGRGAV